MSRSDPLLAAQSVSSTPSCAVCQFHSQLFNKRALEGSYPDRVGVVDQRFPRDWGPNSTRVAESQLSRISVESSRLLHATAVHRSESVEPIGGDVTVYEGTITCECSVLGFARASDLEYELQRPVRLLPKWINVGR